MEAAFTRHPILDPAFLYGGYPPKELQHKFLMAKPSDAQVLTPACLPEGFEWLSLPGHFFDMVGFRTPDDVVYLADCLSSRETLEKYQIGFLYDVAAYLNTLEMVKTLTARAFVPGPVRPLPGALAKTQVEGTHFPPGDELPPPLLRTDVMGMEDLKPGMELTGTVRNVIDFGAFVDIGVHQDGLVHISQLSDKFIRHPGEAVKVGQVVKVKVLDVDLKKKRISLTMKGLNN